MTMLKLHIKSSGDGSNTDDDMNPLLSASASALTSNDEDGHVHHLGLEMEEHSYTSSQTRRASTLSMSTSASASKSTSTLKTSEVIPTLKSESSSSSSTSESEKQKWQIISYILIFFFTMIGHEVALEAASKQFHHLDSLASAVTLFQFGFCFFLPLFTSTKEVLLSFPRTYKEMLPYVHLSILVFGATGLATQSLKYVSYPTKVVFKSAKLIPTMLISTCITTKKNNYGALDYFAALLLCLGAAGYSFNSSSGHESGGGTDDTDGDEGGNDNDGAHNQTSVYGICLLSISMICDSIVPNLQQKLMMTNTYQWLQLPNRQPSSSLSSQGGHHHHRNHPIEKENTGSGLSAQAVMVNTNAVGFALILVYMLLSGSLMDAISTAITDPMLLFYLICVGVGLSIAVLAYTKLIHSSGSVVAVAISTLRKVVTVLLSYILFPKPLLTIHIFSGLLVLIGVLIGTFCRKK